MIGRGFLPVLTGHRLFGDENPVKLSFRGLKQG
jgi:hypothetical protein